MRKPCNASHGLRTVSHTMLDMAVLKIEAPAFDAMLAACKAAHPYEACGLLGGRDEWAFVHVPVPNAAADPARRFDMDPREFGRALRDLGARSLAVVAVYHSHPRTAPAPSRADIEEFSYPDAYSIIVGLASLRPQVRAFRIFPELGRAVEVRWMKVAARP